MTPGDLYTRFRQEVRDEASPFLWSAVEVWSYMDDAQKEFCRLTGGIADSSSAITVLSVTAGDKWIPYDSRILKLRGLNRSDYRDVSILNYEDLDNVRAGPNDYGQHHLVRFSDNPAPVRAVIVGMDANRLRLADIAQNDDVLQASVYRLPLQDITDGTGTFEIDSQHHLHLLDWMKHLAHKKQDAETYDRGRSDEFRAAFLGYCDLAKSERERREHKYRTVAYGGY